MAYSKIQQTVQKSYGNLLNFTNDLIFEHRYLSVRKEIVFRDDTHMTPMKIFQFVRPPSPLVHCHPKFFHLFNLGRPISNESPPSPNVNLLVKRKHNPRIAIICYQVLPSGWLSFSRSTH